MNLRAVCLALLLCALPLRAFAHGGEEHSHEESSSLARGASEHTASAETELYTVVLKYPARGAVGRPLAARLYVADAATAAPIEAATVRVELHGVADVRATPRAGEPGVYELTIAEPAAGTEHEAVVTIEAPGGVDLVPLTHVHFGPAEPLAAPPATAANANRTRALFAAALVGGSSLLLFLGFALLARRRTTQENPS